MVRSRLFSLCCLAVASIAVLFVGSLTGSLPFSDISAATAYLKPPLSSAVFYSLPFHLQLQVFAAFAATAALSFTLASRADRATRFRRFEPVTGRAGHAVPS